MANKAIRKVYGSGPTHISVDNFAERIFQISSHIAERCNTRKLEDDATRTRRHLVIRGYRLEHEVEAFLNILSSGVASNAAKPRVSFGSPSRWTLGLSVAFWLLVVLGSKTVRPLHHDDSATVHDIRSILMERKTSERSFMPVGSWADVLRGTPAESCISQGRHQATATSRYGAYRERCQG